MTSIGLKNSMRDACAAIRKARSIIVASHVNPDGDTIGSMLALGLGLIQLGKKVYFLSQDGIPTRYQFLPGSELIRSSMSETADVSISVDCGSAKQLGSVQNAFFRSKTTVQVDHHDFGDAFGKVMVIDEEASAVGEIVFDLLRALKIEITPAIATCLLTSIIVDTGAFRFSNIRPRTFDICSRLIRKGVDLQHLIEESYWLKSRAAARLSGYAVQRAKFLAEGRLSYTWLTRKDFVRFKAKMSDTDGVADELRCIEGVKIAAVLRQAEDRGIRVSLRSSSGINVANIARTFGGGGHHNSAGCRINGTEKDRRRLLDELAALVS